MHINILKLLTLPATISFIIFFPLAAKITILLLVQKTKCFSGEAKLVVLIFLILAHCRNDISINCGETRQIYDRFTALIKKLIFRKKTSFIKFFMMLAALQNHFEVQMLKGYSNSFRIYIKFKLYLITNFCFICFYNKSPQKFYLLRDCIHIKIDEPPNQNCRYRIYSHIYILYSHDFL